ncbi:MAG: GNAT family N-acetyltransferase [Deltaproteobacteria bacterium]|nr:GNAT family N-acetyltransferase [Deltaproteobacteria bacterium]
MNRPLRPSPSAQLRRINDEETRLALAHLNADAYGVPHEWGRLALGAALARSELFGRVAYVGDEPASGAFALRIDRALYIAWVATAKEFRGLGLAELVIRACLDDAKEVTHLERSCLHATAAGLPVYFEDGVPTHREFSILRSQITPGGDLIGSRRTVEAQRCGFQMVDNHSQYWTRVAPKYDCVVALQIGWTTRSLPREIVSEEHGEGSLVEFGCGTALWRPRRTTRSQLIFLKECWPPRNGSQRGT